MVSRMTLQKPTKILFFQSPLELNKWFKANHKQIQVQWIGFYKKDSGRASITWPESVDEALCFGWIDGVRKKIDEASYAIRFTPRRPKSHWSTVNIKRAVELLKLGRMHDSGLKAFHDRNEKTSIKYSYERKNCKLDGRYERRLKENKKAWDFFRAQAPSYQSVFSRWIMSARKEETRLKRLAVLIQNSEKDKKLDPLAPGKF
jgi:uncharacterized protein YdeI (YjbR/CyaY-like superfamily)